MRSSIAAALVQSDEAAWPPVDMNAHVRKAAAPAAAMPLPMEPLLHRASCQRQRETGCIWPRAATQSIAQRPSSRRNRMAFTGPCRVGFARQGTVAAAACMRYYVFEIPTEPVHGPPTVVRF